MTFTRSTILIRTELVSSCFDHNSHQCWFCLFVTILSVKTTIEPDNDYLVIGSVAFRGCKISYEKKSQMHNDKDISFYFKD